MRYHSLNPVRRHVTSLCPRSGSMVAIGVVAVVALLLALPATLPAFAAHITEEQHTLERIAAIQIPVRNRTLLRPIR